MAKSKYFYSRLTEDEFSAVKMLAARAGVKNCEFVRVLVHAEADRVGLPIGLIDYVAKNPSLADTHDRGKL